MLFDRGGEGFVGAVCENLKQLRLARGMTQEEAARRMNVTRQTISSYESDRTRPDLETVKHFAEVYDVSIQDILYGGDRLQAQRGRVRRLAWAAMADLVLCSLIHSALLWTANRFFRIPEGVLTPELRGLFYQRLEVAGAAETVEVFSLLSFGLLGLLLAVLAARLEKPFPVKTRLAYLALLAAGTALAVLPWALDDPVFGLANYSITPSLQLAWAAVLVLATLLADLLHRWKTT